VTSLSDELFSFIGSSFRSVWALELLLLLKREHRSWSREELITTLRASELVVNKAIDELVAAGLISVEGDGARYMPVSEDIANNVKQVEKVYSARPDAVRRAIVSASASGATAFADAFRLRKD
jgi:formaldehyde-activating enzyme involved in methanogenesis